MEKQKLPNATAVLLLGILSIFTCCCWGMGIVLGVLALVLAKKSTALYRENPDAYEGYNSISIGKALATIGIILGSIFLIFAIYLNVAYTQKELQEMQQNLYDKMEYQKEMDS